MWLGWGKELGGDEGLVRGCALAVWWDGGPDNGDREDIGRRGAKLNGTVVNLVSLLNPLPKNRKMKKISYYGVVVLIRFRKVSIPMHYLVKGILGCSLIYASWSSLFIV